jgi:hypothetical protein
MQEAKLTRQYKVSLREVNEESYRALRAAGYSWGQAQIAGRISGVSQVLWGTGVSAIVADATRFLGVRRLPKVSSNDSFSNINAKGSKFPSFAPLGFAVALGKPNNEVFFQNAALTKDIACALWDIEQDSADSFFWGNQDPTPSGYSVSKGDLYQHGNPLDSKTTVWSLNRKVMPEGKLLLSKNTRHELIEESLRSGVAVDKAQWANLKKMSWKFLVPE